MPAAVHLQLFSGFPPAAWDADRRFDEELGDRLRSLRFERRTPENDLLQVVGAPTMRLFLGEPGWPVPMIVERRFERVRIGDWVAEDVEGRLLDWTGLARPGVPRHVLNVDELAMARRMLSEPPPDGVRAVGAIPEGPTPDEREHPCPAAPSSTALSDWIVESGSNNCYNFAAQVLFRRSLPATPGGASPARLEPGDTCVEVTQALAADGIHGVDPVPESCPPGGHYIMVMTRQWRYRSDYHCLRLNSDGRWSHKDGTAAFPTDRDDAGHEIRSIRSARFRYDWTFCGFYFVPSDCRLSP